MPKCIDSVVQRDRARRRRREPKETIAKKQGRERSRTESKRHGGTHWAVRVVARALGPLVCVRVWPSLPPGACSVGPEIFFHFI